MEAARVLFIGRIQANRSPIASALEKRYQVLYAPSGKLGADLIQEKPFQIVVLDAVSMRTPGDRICLGLRKSLGRTPIVHLHPGPKAAAQSVADAVLFPPFSTRKVTGSIERLLQPQSDETVTYGPFSMNLSRRILFVNGQETQLTPKQALLIETFLRHPGEVLDRKTLMENVWQTDYLGDTRTLDVHIRWIREVIEDDPGNPQYLRTVRGVGYTLEVPVDEFAQELVSEPLMMLPN
jgi:DNA-binding response OmpR family regulator